MPLSSPSAASEAGPQTAPSTAASDSRHASRTDSPRTAAHAAPRAHDAHRPTRLPSKLRRFAGRKSPPSDGFGAHRARHERRHPHHPHQQPPRRPQHRPGPPEPRRLSGWLRTQLRRRSLAQILTWLDQPEVIKRLGAPTCKGHRTEVQREVRRCLTSACSAAWMAGYINGGESYYIPGMVLSRIGTRADGTYGAGPPTPRWTPAECVKLEDMLDAMTPMRAAHYAGPPSATGIQIQRIRMFRGEKLDQRMRKPSKQRDRSKAVQVAASHDINEGQTHVFYPPVEASRT